MEGNCKWRNCKASLSQVVFFHNQLVYSFHWPISLVPSLQFLNVSTLCWLPVAFINPDSGFPFSWLVPALRAVAQQGGVWAFTWRTHTTSTTGTFFCRQKFRTGPCLVLSILPNLQRAFSSHHEKGYLFMTDFNYLWSRLQEESQSQGLKAIRGRWLFSNWANLPKDTSFPVERILSPTWFLTKAHPWHIKQWGGGQAEHVLIQWHEGEASPSSFKSYDSWQVKSHLDIYFQITSEKCKTPLHVKYEFSLLFSSLALCICICLLFFFLIIFYFLAFLVAEKPTNIKTLRHWGCLNLGLGQYFGLVSSCAVQRLNIHWQLFLSPIQLTNASCWHQAQAEHGEINLEEAALHQVTEYMRCGSWETGFSWLTEVKQRSIPIHYFKDWEFGKQWQLQGLRNPGEKKK